ncbi:thioredoxin reductase (NADPH) [Salsuginibacillus halophilus]|uniref:Ferredoxin--NADP reductase n=1 Tax=Salsuginibacillus halophilus TaxID=517424 RepID=A0A2P8H8N0_9BACI|nr:NAD(P)/FAD-dependent oxidoreductase [Salsuginibacillus halophilus]PSL42587.1 thioredoxin reductase (NADPH) [Salsuginibacillus halophilus]
MAEEMYDVTVIGGGPTGLFAAFYAGMRGMSVKVIDSMPQLGGQLAALYPEKYIYDVAGFPKVRAGQLVEDLTEQAKAFDPAIVLEETVEQVEKQLDGSIIVTTHQAVHHSRTVIITAGVGAFEPRRLQIQGAAEMEKQHLHYFVEDMSEFSGKHVLISGGGDSALDWALMLEPVAEKVTLVHRRDKFRAHEHSVTQLEQSGIEVFTPYSIQSVEGDAGQLAPVTLEHVKDGSEIKVPADEILVNHGFVSSLGPIKSWGLNIEKNAITVNNNMETNIPGVYAAGDIATYEGKVKLIATGFGEAPLAVNHAKASIDPEAKLQPAHSTSLFS